LPTVPQTQEREAFAIPTMQNLFWETHYL